MTRIRSVLLASCLAAPLALAAGPALAQSPTGGRILSVPPGAVVLVLPAPSMTAMQAGGAAFSPDMPFARLIAQQETMMRRMLQDVDAMMAAPFPDPQQLIRAASQGDAPAMPGAGVVMTAISSASGSCSETITYAASNGGPPQVKVTRTGNACDALPVSGPFGISQTAAPSEPQPVPPPQGGHLWTIGNQPHPLAGPVPPRT